MAWIESHQSLERHPKTLLLRRVTLLSHNEVLGVLHRLWWWALDNAHDGDVTDFCKKGLMEEVFGIPEKEEKSLAECLIEAGWLDKEGDKIVIHNHGRYRDRITEMREMNKLRQKEWRERRKNKINDNNTVTLRNVTGNENNAQQDITRHNNTYTHKPILRASPVENFEAAFSESYQSVIDAFRSVTGVKAVDSGTKEGARTLAQAIDAGELPKGQIRHVLEKGLNDPKLPNQTMRGVARNWTTYLPNTKRNSDVPKMMWKCGVCGHVHSERWVPGMTAGARACVKPDCCGEMLQVKNNE